MTKPKTMLCRRCLAVCDKAQSLYFCSAACAALDKVAVKSIDECWLWRGFTDEKGYGKFRFGKMRLRPYRVIHEKHFGVSLGNLCALHRCDNPACCNPHHIFAGSRADNIRDMDSKGRRIILKGERSGNAVLTEVQVLAIRAELAGGAIQRVVAEKYGVSVPTIQAIKVRRNWPHI